MTLEPPKEDMLDTLINTVRAVAELIPGGSVITTLLNGFFSLPAQRRIDKWRADISHELHRLDQAGVDLDKLKNNEEFIDILHQATRIASTTHQSEKRQALKYAVLHAAQNTAPEFTLQQIFLNYVDVFTMWHIKTLVFLIDPRQWFAANNKPIPGIGMGGIGFTTRDILEISHSDLKGKRDLVNSIWTDLYNKELLTSSKEILDNMTNPNDTLSTKATGLGKIFINFISE